MYTNLQEKSFEEGSQAVFFKDKGEFLEKLLKMKTDGVKELQIVSDFDQTITCFEINCRNSCSLFGAFRVSQKTSEKFKIAVKELYDKYAPIEISTEIDAVSKEKLLKEWYFAIKDVFLSEKLTKNKCLEVLNHANIGLRYGFRRFFALCKQLDLPFYLISGGITQSLVTIIEKTQNLKDYSSFCVFSNELVFDEEERLADLKIKVFPTTKAGILAGKKPGFLRNTLVFGDLESDVDMARNMGSETLICIGFLEKRKEHLLGNYLQKYDLVIVGDGDFVIHDWIVRFIAGIGMQRDPEFEEKVKGNKNYELF